MSKRLFQVLDEMNVNDDVNKTASACCCFDMVSADTVKAGGVIKMGVSAEAITKIFLGEYQPILILLDKKEYHKLKDQPVVDKRHEAEQRAERYEKALQRIEQFSDPGDYWKAICDMKSIATDALTTKNSTE